MRIAGEYTCGEWLTLSARLDPDGRLPNDKLDADWAKTIEVIETRLRTRFVAPVEAIISFEYAGFLVVAIDSLLAEALQRVRMGWRLRERKSSELVVTFLRDRPSFGGAFVAANHALPYLKCPCIACDFYRNVRGGIVHEGETQGGWRVRFGEPELVRVDGGTRTLDRNRFHIAVETELRSYLTDLGRLGHDELRKNVKSTLDGICG